jgi:hypothetical protein
MSKKKKSLTLQEFIDLLPFFEIVDLAHKYGYEINFVPLEKELG